MSIAFVYAGNLSLAEGLLHRSLGQRPRNPWCPCRIWPKAILTWAPERIWIWPLAKWWKSNPQP